MNGSVSPALILSAVMAVFIAGVAVILVWKLAKLALKTVLVTGLLVLILVFLSLLVLAIRSTSVRGP